MSKVGKLPIHVKNSAKKLHARGLISAKAMKRFSGED
jgi:hypothetical protein